VRSDLENWKMIGQDVLVYGRSQRAACEKDQLGGHTLKKILANAEPQRQFRDGARHAIRIASENPFADQLFAALTGFCVPHRPH